MDALYRYDDSGSVLSIEDTPSAVPVTSSASATTTCGGSPRPGRPTPPPRRARTASRRRVSAAPPRTTRAGRSTRSATGTSRPCTPRPVAPTRSATTPIPHQVRARSSRTPSPESTRRARGRQDLQLRLRQGRQHDLPAKRRDRQRLPAEHARRSAGADVERRRPAGRQHPAGGQATTYVYDADGRRIARKEPGGTTTLFLPNMELKQTGTVVAGTRYYSFGGHTVAVRTGSGVDFQAADHHGTAGCTISAATGAITWRRTTPYGAGRGQAPASWPDQKGFIGGTQDPTGLVNLGAREYDPLLGRFISVDPIMDLTDPQQWSAYSYGNSSPLVVADPSGLLGSASCAPGEVGGPGACTGSENGNGPGDPGTKPDPPLLTIPLAYDGELDWVEYRWLNERYGYIGSAKMTMRDLLDWKAGKRDRRAFYVDDESNFMGEVCDFMGRSGCGFGAQRSMQQGLESWKDLPVAGIAANLLLAVSYTATDDADKALESLIDGVGAVPVGGGVAVGGVEFGLGEVADIAKTVASSAVEGRKGYGFGAVGPASDIWVEKSGLIQIGSEPDSRDQIDAEWTSYRSIAPIPTEWLVAARRSGPETVQSLVGFFVQTGIWEKG
ncbi:RHS repeat-associated core domain-containing protein [Catellatospora coxensis]